MAKFISKSTTATLIGDYALDAFDLETFEDFEVKSIIGVGIVVKVLKGQHKGNYDYYPEDNSFITA